MALRAAEGMLARASALTGGRRARENAAESSRKLAGTLIGAHRNCDGRGGMALRAAEGRSARASALTGGRRARENAAEGQKAGGHAHHRPQEGDERKIMAQSAVRSL